MEDFSDLAGGLAAFDLDHEPTADSGGQSELILRQALILPFSPDLLAQIPGVFDGVAYLHRLFPNGNISSDSNPMEVDVPERERRQKNGV